MSKIAGLILLILGGFFVYLGGGELVHLQSLTRYAAFVTTATGALVVLAGLLHFKAPHKAFLLSIPFLISFQVVVFANGHYFYDQKRWLYYQVLSGIVSVLTLWISYRGYRQKKTAP